MKIGAYNLNLPKSKASKIVLSIFLFLVAVRIALPFIGKYYINHILKDHVEGYTGHIDDFDLSLYRGAYQMQDFVLQKVEGKIPVPFMSAKEIDFSIAWRPLFRGHVVGRVTLDKFKLNFVNANSKANTQTGLEGKGWQEAVDKMFPLEIEELAAQDSEIHFRDFEKKPPIDIFLNDASLLVTNLTNTKNEKKELVSDYSLFAKVQKEGDLRVKGGVSILEKPLAIDINLAATHVMLIGMNEFFKSYANFDVGKGRLDLFAEVASKKGKVTGYVKPFLTHMEILKGKDSKDDAATGTDVLASLVNLIVRRYSKDQVAAKIPFSGDLSDPKVEVWPAVKSMFRHAFGKALDPKIDREINIADVNTKKPNGNEQPKKRERLNAR
jgi:hypothetical protein